MGLNCNKNNGSGSVQNVQSFMNSISFPDVTEAVKPATNITRTAEENANMLLESGQYKVKFKTDITDTEQEAPFTLKNFTIDVPVENEYKRIRIFKMDSVPVSESKREVTVKFAVIDNPVWLAPILWTLPAVGSWFVIDKVEHFSDSNPFGFSLLTLGVISALGVFFFK